MDFLPFFVYKNQTKNYLKLKKKKRRFKYDIIDSIIGLEFEKAKDVCYFNGYLLTNEEVKVDNGFYYISYELRNNKIVKANFKNNIKE